jgi:DNA-binding transcriptional regulator LsrR (DeoR family)
MDEDATRWACWPGAQGPDIGEPTEEVRTAFLCAWELTLGLSIDEICERTGRGRATVYRALDYAERLGILDRTVRLALPQGQGARELLDHVTMPPLACRTLGALRERFGENAPAEVVVVPTSGKGATEEEATHTRARVSRAGARRLMQGVLGDGVRVIGVSWGLAVRDLANALPGGVAQRIPFGVASDITVFSFAGAFLGSAQRATQMHMVSGNANAVRLRERMAAFCVEPEPYPPSEAAAPLPPVVLSQPLMLPEGIAATPKRLAHVWDLMSEEHSLQKVFGRDWALRRKAQAANTRTRDGGRAEGSEPPSLLEQADVLVTATGKIDEAIDPRELGTITEEELPALIAEGTIAGLSSQMVVRPGTLPTAGGAVDRYNSRAVTPQVVDFAAATRRARLRGRGLGTMLLGRHPRAEAVHAVVATGAVNVLVVDSYCAEELVRLCTAEAAQ